MWWIYVILAVGGILVILSGALMPMVLGSNINEGRRMRGSEEADLDVIVASIEAELREDHQAAQRFASNPTTANLWSPVEDRGQ